MNKTGKESLKRRIKELVTEKIDLQQAATARLIFLQYTKDQVHNVSSGAATFYIWVIVQFFYVCKISGSRKAILDSGETFLDKKL